MGRKSGRYGDNGEKYSERLCRIDFSYKQS